MKCESLAATGRFVFALAFALGFSAVAIPSVQAQTFSVVHNFTGGSDGAGPLSGFVADGAGNLYGTTNAGGASNYGVVFKMNSSGVEAVLHSFNGGTDGANPEGRLIRDKAGNLYGTTTAGGAFGAGTVFGVTSAGKEVVLHSFNGAAGGADPEAGLAMDASRKISTVQPPAAARTAMAQSSSWFAPSRAASGQRRCSTALAQAQTGRSPWRASLWDSAGMFTAQLLPEAPMDTAQSSG